MSTNFYFLFISFSCCRILGPPALQQAVRFSEGLVWNNRPIYNYCMRGVITCFTGIRKKDELVSTFPPTVGRSVGLHSQCNLRNEDDEDDDDDEEPNFCAKAGSEEESMLVNGAGLVLDCVCVLVCFGTDKETYPAIIPRTKLGGSGKINDGRFHPFVPQKLD